MKKKEHPFGSVVASQVIFALIFSLFLVRW